jgi:uncharacterized protein DUF4396
MAPLWLTTIAWVYLSICFGCAVIIGYDIVVSRRRQPMGVMNFVFPITGLYLGPFALTLYWRWGRAAAAPGTPAMANRIPAAVASTSDHRAHHGMADVAGADGPGGAAPPGERARPWWVAMAMEVSHCGAGCSLGDVISEFGIFALGLSIAGFTLGAEYIGDYVLALAFGIIFQFFAIAPMRGLGPRDGIVAAVKADFISLTAFEVGLFGWMAIMTFVLFPAPNHLMPDSATYWLLMQVGMIIGYLTSWPANMWLVKRGIKVPM